MVELDLFFLLNSGSATNPFPVDFLLQLFLRINMSFEYDFLN